MEAKTGGGKGTAGAWHLANIAGRPWERRKQPRYSQREAARRYNMDSIGVRVTTLDGRFGATLVDLSTGGACVMLSSPLPPETPLGIELQIGQYTVVAFCFVKSVSEQNGLHRLGVQFVQIDPDEEELLRFLEHPDHLA